MKIRVTFILLLCTSLAANGKDTIKAQQTSPNSKFSNINHSELRHQVYQYSKSMEALNVPSKIVDGIIIKADVPSFAKSSTEESERSSKYVTDDGMKSKQPSRTLQVEVLPVQEEVLSRGKKDKMEQAMLPLLIAYKMKFAALIPILVGGLSLLASTTALAGFFFALFAAVLGLKAH